MKSISMTIILLLSGLWAGAQNVTVKSNEKEGSSFKDYKTFYWMSNVDNVLDPGLYFLDDINLKTNIRASVQSEFEGLGYTLEPNSPDLLVNFRVFDQPTTLKGYESYGAKYWDNFDAILSKDFESYDVKAGTLLLSIAEKKSGEIVWQGFASGLIDGNAFIKDQSKIKEAVNLLFDQYSHRASEYSIN